MKNFDRDFKRVGRAVGFVFIFNILLSLAVLSGIAWVAYVLLKHFGIVGWEEWGVKSQQLHRQMKLLLFSKL